MKVILFGAPGSGKGTQAVMLSEYLGVKKISLGDILREEVKKDSELGKEVKNYMESGALVPDEVVAKVIEENIKLEGFVLDGYPRNLSQVQKLDEILKKSNNDIDIFIYLDVNEQTIIDRLSKRRICKACGVNYHLVNMAPKQNGICDKCRGELIQRKDDNPEVIKKRWEVFSSESQKILNFYRNREKLIIVEGRGDRFQIFEGIKKALK